MWVKIILGPAQGAASLHLMSRRFSRAPRGGRKRGQLAEEDKVFAASEATATNNKLLACLRDCSTPASSWQMATQRSKEGLPREQNCGRLWRLCCALQRRQLRSCTWRRKRKRIRKRADNARSSTGSWLVC